MANDALIRALLGLGRPPRRRIFISYHHELDRHYYETFRSLYSDLYDVVQDSSVDRAIDSDDPDYVIRRIREGFITGTSCTFVLCGVLTRWRKYVDWEIKATVDKGHGLIGVNLPTNPADAAGCFHKPDRLQDNLDSGFALWVQWGALSAGTIPPLIELANSKPSILMAAPRSLRRRNGP